MPLPDDSRDEAGQYDQALAAIHEAQNTVSARLDSFMVSVDTKFESLADKLRTPMAEVASQHMGEIVKPAIRSLQGSVAEVERTQTAAALDRQGLHLAFGKLTARVDKQSASQETLYASTVNMAKELGDQQESMVAQAKAQDDKLTTTAGDLDARIGTLASTLAKSLERQREKFKAGLAELNGTFVAFSSTAGERQKDIEASLASLDESATRHEQDIANLRTLGDSAMRRERDLATKVNTLQNALQASAGAQTAGDLDGFLVYPRRFLSIY